MEASDKSFPVVGIGASAGGLEAISEFIAELPATTGMAYLLVQHLDPHHRSFLTEILAKKAVIAVETAADGTTVMPDRLYVIPPNSTLTLSMAYCGFVLAKVKNGLTSPSISCFARSLSNLLTGQSQ